MYTAMPKAELLKTIKKMLADQERGISVRSFAELAGMSERHLWDVFVYETATLTEVTQRRVTNAYNAWKNGYVAIMRGKDRHIYPDYRREARPRAYRGMKIDLKNGQIGLKVGVFNRCNYDEMTLEDLFKKA
jgi:hypothetical protein